MTEEMKSALATQAEMDAAGVGPPAVVERFTAGELLRAVAGIMDHEGGRKLLADSPELMEESMRLMDAAYRFRTNVNAVNEAPSRKRAGLVVKFPEA